MTIANGLILSRIERKDEQVIADQRIAMTDFGSKVIFNSQLAFFYCFFVFEIKLFQNVKLFKFKTVLSLFVVVGFCFKSLGVISRINVSGWSARQSAYFF